MDKKKQMAFNLNNFLLAISTAFDFREKELYNISLGHSKRVAYMALKLGFKYNLEPKQMADLCAYALAYNIEEENLKKIPFLNSEETLANPLFKKIISFASTLDRRFSLGINDIKKREKAISFMKENDEVDFLQISSTLDFWFDLQNENEILMFIYSSLHDFTTILNFEEILEITKIFHFISNQNSQYLDFCEKLLDEYNFEYKDKFTFLITASLQNIGKFNIPLKILDKKDKLTSNEFELIKAYPYYTKKILNNIMGFSDIAIFASKVQERIDSRGYPFSLSGKDLSLKDRLLICLTIYNALRENRAYRVSYSHDDAISIMNMEASNGKLDAPIVWDINRVLF